MHTEGAILYSSYCSTVGSSFGTESPDNPDLADKLFFNTVCTAIRAQVEGYRMQLLIMESVRIYRSVHVTRACRLFLHKHCSDALFLMQGPGGKMSSSSETSAIFVTDTPKQVELHYNNATCWFGGDVTICRQGVCNLMPLKRLLIFMYCSAVQKVVNNISCRPTCIEYPSADVVTAMTPC